MDGTNRRAQWQELPPVVKARIEQELGGPVLATEPRHGGYTLGMASVLRTNDDAAFVKAISASDFMADSYRKEAANVKCLPEAVPVPRLRFDFEIDGWVVLATEAIEGSALPAGMTQSELDEVLDSVRDFQASLNPSPLVGLHNLSEVLPLDVWSKLNNDGAAGLLTLDRLPTRLRQTVPHLAEMEARAIEAVEGEALLHLDIRHDNILKDPDGNLWFVDWSAPALGAPWVDVVAFLPTVANDKVDREATFARYRGDTAVDAEDVDAFLVGLAGYWLANANQPQPSNAPHLRAYQARCAAACVNWLNQRGHNLGRLSPDGLTLSD